jgi:hypothetical protein
MRKLSYRDLFQGSCAIFLATSLFNGGVRASEAFERTEEREPCSEYSAAKLPLFGDLRVHTSYSFDSYASIQHNDPDGAYRYARGEAITLPDADANQDVIAQIQRPLDFTAVTDHAEFLGPTLDPAEHPFYSPTLQERAWTSPIWINPLQTKEASS